MAMTYKLYKDRRGSSENKQNQYFIYGKFFMNLFLTYRRNFTKAFVICKKKKLMKIKDQRKQL